MTTSEPGFTSYSCFYDNTASTGLIFFLTNSANFVRISTINVLSLSKIGQKLNVQA